MAQSFLFENGQLGPSVEVAFNWDDGAAAAGPSSSTEDGATSIAVLERAVRETFGLDDFLAFGIVYAPVARKGLSPVPITTRADVEYCARLQRTLGKRITLSIVDTAELDAALLAIRSRSASPTRSAPASAKRYHVEQWLRLSLEHTLLKIEPGLYRQFMERPPTETDAVLRRDLGRTFPETKMFADSALATDEDGDGKARLFNVLHAVVTRDCERKDHIGVQPMAYVQGMNFVAAHLLRRGATDEEAFWMMVRLFECNHYGVSELYSPGLPRLMTTMLQVEELLDPELASHFVANGFRMNMFIPQWVLTLFANKVRKCSDAEREKETETETRELLLRAQSLRLPLFRIFELLPLLTPTRLLSLSLSLYLIFLSLSFLFLSSPHHRWTRRRSTLSGRFSLSMDGLQSCAQLSASYASRRRVFSSATLRSARGF